ncbi:MAG TPA: hypothetical protein VF311_09600 [Terriglobales bacterium]|jgi:hypothetical protein
MRSLLCLAALSLLFGSPLMQAQVKGSFTETSVCGNSSVHQTVLINDDRQHSVSLDQRPCTSKAPIEIGGLTGTEYISYGVDDVQNQHAVDRGYVVGTMKNGDRYFLRYEGTATMNGSIPDHLEGKWTFTGGSGRLKQLQGSGTYTARPTLDGGMEFIIQGNYELP